VTEPFPPLPLSPRQRPRFLLISGDLINAFPLDDHAAVAAREVPFIKGSKEASDGP